MARRPFGPRPKEAPMHRDHEETVPQRRWIAWALAESARLDVTLPWERREDCRKETAEDARR